MPDNDAPLTRREAEALDDADQQRARAEAAEQERDQALQDLRSVTNDRDRLIEANKAIISENANLREHLDRLNTERQRIQDLDTNLRQQLAQLIAAAPAADRAHRQLRAIREAREHTCGSYCTEGGCDFDLAGFVDRVDAILAGGIAADVGCPTCQTILNAKATGCADLWHQDNRAEPDL